MTLHDVIQTDGLNVFCNANDFGETVTYYPRDGSPRSIVAVVIRNAISPIPEEADIVSPVFEIHVHNDCETGIASDELNLGGDAIEFARRVGECTERRFINRMLDHDEGMLVLECR